VWVLGAKASAILEGGHTQVAPMGTHPLHPTLPSMSSELVIFAMRTATMLAFFFFLVILEGIHLDFPCSGFLYVSIISRLLGGLVSDRQQRQLVLTAHVLMEEMWPEPMSPHPQKGSDS